MAKGSYETIVSSYSVKRRLGATAMFHLAEIDRTLGKDEEAAAQNQLVLRWSPVQRNLVLLASQACEGVD